MSAGAWAIGAAAVALALLSNDGETLEYAALTHRARDGEFFLPWLVLYRLGYVREPLRLGDEAFNRRLIGAAPLAPLCLEYLVRERSGALQPVSFGWRPAFSRWADAEVRRWIDRCTAHGLRPIDGKTLRVEPHASSEAKSEAALLRVLSERPDRVVASDGAGAEEIASARALAHAGAAAFGAEPAYSRPATRGIPRLLHQLWIGPRRPPLEAMETWKRLNPGLTHVFWNEARLAQALPAGQIAHAMTCREINGRADVLRYHLLTKYGGVFVDADAICERPLPDALFALDGWTCFEDENVRPGLLACGYMGASRGNALMADLARRCDAMDLAAFSRGHSAWEFVGNQVMTNVARTLPPGSLAVLPSRCFIGEHYSGARSPGRWPRYARQLWGSTKGYERPELVR